MTEFKRALIYATSKDKKRTFVKYEDRKHVVVSANGLVHESISSVSLEERPTFMGRWTSSSYITTPKEFVIA